MRHALRTDAGPVPVTASFGVAALPENARSVTELVRQADAALYRSKQDGRDRVTALAPTGAAPSAA
jgi:diguanylate cyclase (GGDEF)-like protein